ncbi:hypothetical protein KP509_28G032300 [Ceratopteris richardii]|uniref:Uncharacterized protein n=1 Tax=Ceratopteris richardii TaxID=49495 RepID=A0A8T2RCN1_CERRI|nr:hypothetical protein KP509_28G032300 [Ceratopteris richardii]
MAVQLDASALMWYAPLAVLVVGVAFWALTRRPKMHIPSLKGKHVVITGGSSGIGLCIARQCAAEGAFLTLMARTTSKLEDAKSQIVSSLNVPPDSIALKSVDVSNAEAISAAITESFAWRPIDVLICSAGILEANFIDDAKPSKLEEIARINILGVMFPIQAVIPLMKRRCKEHPSSIVIIGSLSSSIFLYGSNMYTPSKYALKGLAELLKFELLPFNIGVTMSCPAFTQTPMLEEVEKEATAFIQLGERIYLGAKRECPEQVARLTIDAFKRNVFFVSTNLTGMLVRVTGRGFLPAESFSTFLLELILVVPLRILTYLWLLNAKHVLLTSEVPSLKKTQPTSSLAQKPVNS